MKKKVKKYKIAQNGIDMKSNTDPMAWNDSNSLTPNQPQGQRFILQPNGTTIDTLTGQVFYPEDKNQSNIPNMDLVNTTNTVEKTKTGTFEFNPLIQRMNAGIDAVTGIAKTIGNNNNTRREKNDYLKSIYPKAYENKDEDGLNNIPTYFKSGGQVSPEKAREILKDGKANGKKLTSKQKKYFGYIIGQSENMQNGGSPNLISSNDLRQPSQNVRFNPVNAQGVSPDYINDPINAGRQKLPYKYDYKLPENSPWLNERIQGNNYDKYQGVMLNGKPVDNPTVGQAIQVNTDYFMKNNPSSNVYRNENQHYSFDGYTPKYGDDPSFMQNGGMISRPITAEAGEIYKNTQGQLTKIPDHMDDHDDASGGVEVHNASQVLEDTGDKRNDIDSKLLLIQPKEMLDISGLKIKKPVTHSKAFELMTKDAEKNSNYIQKYLKRNKKSLDDSPNDIYAKNSMDMNANLLGAVPTQADVFNKLFAHQEAIKNKYQIDQENEKMQNGGSNITSKNIAEKQKLDRLWQKLNASVVVDDNGDDTQYNKYKKEYEDYLAYISTKASENTPEEEGNGFRFAQPNPNRIPPVGNGINAYKGDRANKSNASMYTDEQWRQFAKDAGFSGNNNREFQNFLFNMNGDQGSTDLQSTIIGLHDKYGNPNTPPTGKSMYNWLDGRLGHRWDKAYEEFYRQKQGTPNEYQTPPEDYFSDTPDGSGTPTGTPSTPTPNYQLPPQSTTKNPENKFSAPLKWYDTAAATYGLIDSMGRKGVNYDGIDLVAPKAKYQNPLPALQQGQIDYNAVLDTLPQNGVGYANSANVFGKKYAMDSQILGQYENINNNIWNQNEQAVVNTKNAQSQADQQARQMFEQKQLAGIEAQRQQFFQSLKDLTGTIASNAKYNREGNLLMKLFPAFDQNANYNGYKYNFFNPGRTAPATPETKKTIKKTK